MSFKRENDYLHRRIADLEEQIAQLQVASQSPASDSTPVQPDSAPPQPPAQTTNLHPAKKVLQPRSKQTPFVLADPQKVAAKRLLSLIPDIARVTEMLNVPTSPEEFGNQLLRIGSIEISRQESEELFRAYVETANDMVYAVDLLGNLTFVNPYGQRLLGCSEAEIIGHPYLEFVAEEYRERTAQAFMELLKTGELRDFEFVLQPKVGPRVHLEVNGRLLYCSDELMGGIGIGRDITERKQVEQQLQMFSKALESAYDSAVITDLKGKILYANPAASRIFHYELDSLKGQNANIFYLAQEQEEWLIQQAIAGGWSGEVICQRQNGEQFPALVSVGPITDEQGTVIAVSVISRDITDQKRIQAELAANNLELERANRLKSQFLANMSHELRTPLTAILGFSSLLGQQLFGAMNDKQLLYTQQIYQSGEHLLNLINDVLDLSKVEAGQMGLEMTPLNISELCQKTLTLVSEQARDRQLTVHQFIQPDLDLLNADPLRLKQMLLNLLSNAIKFSEKGGEIGLEAIAENGDLCLTVWDKGIGIPEDKQPLLFQPFRQLDGSLARRHEGTGLGLALTRRLAELHGGTVECISKLGEGSRFTLRLPLTLGHLPTEPPETFQESASPVPVANQLSHILIVEDHPSNAILLKDVLQHWGYEVHHAVDGWQALDWLKAHAVDLIFLDIQLPGLSGFEVAERIQANPDWRNIPMIATTALAMTGDRDRCLAAGLQDYISKPINYEKLAAVLLKYTGHRSPS